MANFSNIARPYALAAFEYARNKHQLIAWKSFLDDAAEISQDRAVINLLKNPQISSSKLLELYENVLGAQITIEQKNFLKLLAQNERLQAFTEITSLFNSYYAALEKISKVRVITAVDTTEEFQKALTQALSKRLQNEVILQTEIDPAILGGAIIHMGDRVIDDSIRGKLTRLLQSLTD